MAAVDLNYELINCDDDECAKRGKGTRTLSFLNCFSFSLIVSACLLLTVFLFLFSEENHLGGRSRERYGHLRLVSGLVHGGGRRVLCLGSGNQKVMKLHVDFQKP